MRPNPRRWLFQISAVGWADGRDGAWIDGIDPAALASLTHLCGMCAVVFIYMFSGMRDSEVQSLRKGCVEEFWGHITLSGKEFKTFRGGQARWLVIESVAQAARLAETLSWHDERIVVAARPGTDPVIDVGVEIDVLIATMNLAADPACLSASPTAPPSGPTASVVPSRSPPASTRGCRSPCTGSSSTPRTT